MALSPADFRAKRTGPATPELANAVAVVSAVANGLGAMQVDLSGIKAGLLHVGSTVSMLLGNVDLAAQMAASWAAVAGSLRDSFYSAYPPNVADLPELRIGAIMALAEEGITVWTVPQPAVAARLLRATSSADRRRVLGDAAPAILEDCAREAAKATGGAFPDLARLLEQSIRAVQGGHTAAGQALAASVLDTLLQVAFEKHQRVRLTRHARGNPNADVMDHYEELTIGAAMVLRPIWWAYRPQETAELRAQSVTFARHGTAHHIRGRQVSRRNAIQAVMLTTALLAYTAVLEADGAL